MVQYFTQKKFVIFTLMKDKNTSKKNDSVLAEIFAKRLVEVRKERQLSQYQLAEKIGLSRNTIAYYESRAHNPTLEIVERFANFFEISPLELITDPNPKGKPIGQVSKMDAMVKKMKHLSLHKQRMITNAVEAMLNSN
jgi:transcriptional regulator with XRE-family HTH domain